MIKERGNKMSKKQIIIICSGVVLLIAIAIGVYKFSDIFDKEVIANEIEEAPDSIRLKMVGDSLIHNSIYFAAKTDDGYNFDMMFENVKDEIEDADVALEVEIAGGTVDSPAVTPVQVVISEASKPVSKLRLQIEATSSEDLEGEVLNVEQGLNLKDMVITLPDGISLDLTSNIEK
jgi:hypothetical protein